MGNLSYIFTVFIILTSFLLVTSWPDDNITTISHEPPNITTISHTKNKQDFNSAMMESIVQLKFLSPTREGSATGFSVKYDSKQHRTYILTNEHFCAVQDSDAEGFVSYLKATEVFDIEMDYGKAIRRLMVIEHRDASKDLCLLSTSDYIPTVTLEKYNYKPAIMDPIIVIGGPLGVFPIVIDTYISGYAQRTVAQDSRMLDGDLFYLISEIFQPGHSGSPVFNSDGKVFGIIFCKVSEGYGGMALPITDIHKFLKEANI